MTPNPLLICSVPLELVGADFSRTPSPTLTPAGHVAGLRATVHLRPIRKDGTPNDETAPFRVDTGADITQVSLEKALNRWKVKVGIDSGYVRRTTATGTAWVKAFRGSVRVLFPGCADEFELQCLFVEGWPDGTPQLLGLHDLVDKLRVRFDRTPLPSAPYGAVHFERYGP
jgi:hypothetical protein